MAKTRNEAFASASAFAGTVTDRLFPLPRRIQSAKASAASIAIGNAGSAHALAESMGGEIGVTFFRTTAMATTTVTSKARAEARAGSSVMDALRSKTDAAAFVSGTHTRAGEWGRVGLNVRSSQAEDGTNIRLEAGFRNRDVVMSPLDGVFVDFLSVEIEKAAFSPMRFRIENEGDVLIDETFGRVEEAIVFFSLVLDLGELAEDFATNAIDLRFVLEVSNATQGSRFGTIFSVGRAVVPEPGSGVLILTGLILLSSRRRPKDRRHG